VSIWNWIQKYKPQNISSIKMKISEYIIDETLIKVGSENIWLWVAIEPIDREIVGMTISKKETSLWPNDYYPKL
jgi:putative transposase